MCWLKYGWLHHRSNSYELIGLPQYVVRENRIPSMLLPMLPPPRTSQERCRRGASSPAAASGPSSCSQIQVTVQSPKTWHWCSTVCRFKRHALSCSWNLPRAQDRKQPYNTPTAIPAVMLCPTHLYLIATRLRPPSVLLEGLDVQTQLL